MQNFKKLLSDLYLLILSNKHIAIEKNLSIFEYFVINNGRDFYLSEDFVVQIAGKNVLLLLGDPSKSIDFFIKKENDYLVWSSKNSNDNRLFYSNNFLHKFFSLNDNPVDFMLTIKSIFNNLVPVQYKFRCHISSSEFCSIRPLSNGMNWDQFIFKNQKNVIAVLFEIVENYFEYISKKDLSTILSNFFNYEIEITNFKELKDLKVLLEIIID